MTEHGESVTTVDEIHFTVTLYGIEPPAADLMPLASDMDRFLDAVGLPATHISVLGRGFGSRVLRFDNGWKRLQKTAPDAVDSVSLFSFANGSEYSIDKWTACCDIDPELSFFQIGASLDAMPDAERRLMELARGCLARLRPGYGIGFLRDRRDGPGSYGMGMGHGRSLPPDVPRDFEALRVVSRWRNGMDAAVWRDGLLRDVYPYSLLNPRQLALDIDGRPLEDWIRAAPEHGALEPWPIGLTLWTVAPSHLDAVRHALIAAGALYVYRT